MTQQVTLSSNTGWVYGLPTLGNVSQCIVYSSNPHNITEALQLYTKPEVIPWQCLYSAQGTVSITRDPFLSLYLSLSLYWCGGSGGEGRSATIYLWIVQTVSSGCVWQCQAHNVSVCVCVPFFNFPCFSTHSLTHTILILTYDRRNAIWRCLYLYMREQTSLHTLWCSGSSIYCHSNYLNVKPLVFHASLPPSLSCHSTRDLNLLSNCETYVPKPSFSSKIASGLA